jgi:hypothetical protein
VGHAIVSFRASNDAKGPPLRRKPLARQAKKNAMGMAASRSGG